MNETGEEKFINNIGTELDSFSLKVEIVLTAELTDLVNDGDWDQQLLESNVGDHVVCIFLNDFEVIVDRIDLPEYRSQSITPVLESLVDIVPFVLNISQYVTQVSYLVPVRYFR